MRSVGPSAKALCIMAVEHQVRVTRDRKIAPSRVTVMLTYFKLAAHLIILFSDADPMAKYSVG